MLDDYELDRMTAEFAEVKLRKVVYANIAKYRREMLEKMINETYRLQRMYEPQSASVMAEIRKEIEEICMKELAEFLKGSYARG